MRLNVYLEWKDLMKRIKNLPAAPYPDPISNLMDLTGQPVALIKAVLINYKAIPEPGAEDLITFDGPRRTLVDNVATIYCRLTGIPTYKFPYTEAAIIDMHTKYRKLTGERKQVVLNYLGL